MATTLSVMSSLVFVPVNPSESLVTTAPFAPQNMPMEMLIISAMVSDGVLTLLVT